jgi:hypothetical protein
VTIKKEVLINNPYNQFFRIAEDFELMSRLLTIGKKFSFTTVKLLKYRVNDDNVSVGDEERMSLVKLYDTLVKMVRGWIPFDYEILEKIEQKEKSK